MLNSFISILKALVFLPCVMSAFNFIKKETLAQVFSGDFCEISKNTFLHNTSGRLLLGISVKVQNNFG